MAVCNERTAGATVAILVLLALGPLAPGATAQGAACAPQGMSGECNELGRILMDFQREVQGAPIDVTVRTTITDAHREEARSFLFSVRNLTEGRTSPVSVGLVSFATAAGGVVVLKTEQPTPSQLDLWVDVLDVPVGEPIDLTVNVGVRDRGVYHLEALVMPFDRAYEPLPKAGGGDLNLFAFSQLLVNAPSGDAGGNGGLFRGSSVGKALPGPEPWLLAGAAALLALLATPPRMSRRP